MEKILSSLEELWLALTTRGLTVLLLQLLVMARAVLTAILIHRQSHRQLQAGLDSGELPALRRVILKLGQRLAFPISGLFAMLIGKLVFRQFGLDTPLLDTVVHDPRHCARKRAGQAGHDGRVRHAPDRAPDL